MAAGAYHGIYNGNNLVSEVWEKDYVIGRLKGGIIRIAFQKADGSLREMNATLNEDIIRTCIPMKESNKTTRRPPSTDAIPVFDFDKKEWRAFKLSTLGEMQDEPEMTRKALKLD
jgi:hypothetical protein